MTRRERLERKLERRREWAGKADARSQSHFDTAARVADGIPMGQPILVGHHSERHARRDAERIDNNMRAGVEAHRLAEHHAQCASGLEAQLASSIFSDDPCAVTALRMRIADHERQRERMKQVNAAWRKAGKPAFNDEPGWQRVAAAVVMDPEKLLEARRGMALCPWHGQPFPAYALSNLGNRITADKKRIEEIERRAQRQAAAEAAGGVTIAGHGEYTVVTFAEKPAREVLDALKAAGYWWAGGSWQGRTENLPAIVAELRR